MVAWGMSFLGKSGFIKATQCSSPTKPCFDNDNGHCGNRVNLDSEVDLPNCLSFLEETSLVSSDRWTVQRSGWRRKV